MQDLNDHLNQIAQHGNRSKRAQPDGDIIECDDGAELSVVAGGGTHSTPRPVVAGVQEEVDHPETWVEPDFPGPYTAVDVMPYQGVPSEWDGFEEDGVFLHVPVQMVRKEVDQHGGEVSHP